VAKASLECAHEGADAISSEAIGPIRARGEHIEVLEAAEAISVARRELPERRLGEVQEHVELGQRGGEAPSHARRRPCLRERIPLRRRSVASSLSCHAV